MDNFKHRLVKMLQAVNVLCYVCCLCVYTKLEFQEHCIVRSKNSTLAKTKVVLRAFCVLRCYKKGMRVKFQEQLPYRVTTTIEAPFQQSLVSVILQRASDAGCDFYIFQDNELLGNFPQLTVDEAAERAVANYTSAEHEESDCTIFVRYENIYFSFYFYPVDEHAMACDIILQEDYWELKGFLGGRQEGVPDFDKYIRFSLDVSTDFTLLDVATTPLL